MTASVAVFGDGVITIPESIGGVGAMAAEVYADVPPGLLQAMMAETAGNIQASNRNSRGVYDAVMGALAGTVGTNFAEVGTLESKAVQGVYATPLASPVKV